MGNTDFATDSAAAADPEAVLDRLSGQFGADAIQPLLDRFAVMLSEATDALTAGDDRATAHRVAGVAGTLGFSALGQKWLALAGGDEGVVDSVRRESVRALAIIAERNRKASEPKPSV